VAFGFAIAASLVAAVASGLTGPIKAPTEAAGPEPARSGLAAVAGEGGFEPSELVIPDVAENTRQPAGKPGISG
jgi:hypothetical protein